MEIVVYLSAVNDSWSEAAKVIEKIREDYAGCDDVELRVEVKCVAKP